MSDLIDRQTAIDAFEDTTFTKNEIRRRLSELSSAQPDIIYCKDCKKHNIGIGDFWEEENGNRHWYLKDETCPFIPYRGKAQGHEFDYQYCCCGKEKDE